MLSLLAGAWLAAIRPAAESAGGLGVPLAALLVGVGWAWGRELGRLVAWSAVGALLVWGSPASAGDCLERLDSSRPVTLLGDQDSGWNASETGWRSTFRVRRVRQGTTVLGCAARVALSFAGTMPPTGAESVRIKGFLRKYEPLGNGTDRHPVRPSRQGPWRMHIKSTRFWTVEETGLRSSLNPSRIGRWGRRLRGWVEASFTGAGSGPGVGAARALVLGDRAGLEAGFQRSLRRFGLSHLFAVSGLHVALVALLAHWLLRGLRHLPRLGLTSLAVVGYLVLVGARPSIIRATAMALLSFGAVCGQRPVHSRQALCLSAGALVFVDPSLVLNLGYQLTVSATAGILWVAPALADRWQVLPGPLRRSLAATVGAQVTSLPWTASTFSLVHPLAPALNLIAIPWMAIFALGSFVGSALLQLVPASRAFVAAAFDAGVEPVSWLSSLPPSRWIALPVALTFFEGMLLAASLLAALLSRPSVLRLLGLAVVGLLLRGPAISSVAEFIAIDVGQGDAIVLHDGESVVLVDGGGWRRGDIAASVLVPTLARLGIRGVSAAVLTHPDIDHCRGLLDLSYYLPIDRLWSGAAANGSPCARDLLARPRIRWRKLWRGESLRVGRVSLEVLHPGAGSLSRDNDSSIVMRAVLGGRSILLTGDVEAKSERSILACYPPDRLRSQILKLPHHGSKTSTTDRFLAAISPRVAVASAGRRNRYGHPSEEVLERCRRRRVQVSRTDRDGMIRLPLEPYVFGRGR